MEHITNEELEIRRKIRRKFGGDQLKSMIKKREVEYSTSQLQIECKNWTDKYLYEEISIVENLLIHSTKWMSGQRSWKLDTLNEELSTRRNKNINNIIDG